MDLHNLQSATQLKHKKRIGRGGKRGTTSGRGTKGQKSRAGRRIRPASRDMMRKIPKLRGFKLKSLQRIFTVINLDILESKFNVNEQVTPQTLRARKLISFNKGQFAKIKILGRGRLTKKLIFQDVAVSQKALVKILAVGGEIHNLK